MIADNRHWFCAPLDFRREEVTGVSSAGMENANGSGGPSRNKIMFPVSIEYQ